MQDPVFTYEPNRIASQGGMGAVLRRLVNSFGPPDHVDNVRRTWSPNSRERIDFYSRSNAGTLVVTDNTLINVVEQKQIEEVRTSAVDLGF